MEHRTLDIKVVSGRDLKKVNLIMKEETYVVVSLSGDPNNKQKSEVDREGDANPNWNFPAKFTVNESDIQNGLINLEFRIRCFRNLGDKDIGEVIVPIKDLIGSIDDGRLQFVTYQIRKPSGRPKGQLSFSYQWTGKSAGEPVPPPVAAETETSKIDAPVTAYPSVGSSSAYPSVEPAYPAVAGSSSAYPSVEPAYPAVSGSNPQPGGYAPYPPVPVSGYGYPPHGYGNYQPPPPGHGGYGGGYPQPPPPGYGVHGGGGYPPPGYGYGAQPGYGYPPVEKPVKKNKAGGGGGGLGFGAGLLGGAVGGLLIGDMMSDGFGDCGGF